MKIIDALRLSDQRVRYLLLGVSGIGILGLALWYVVTSAPPAIAAAVIAASATILVAVFGTLATRHFERRQEIEREQRERKLEVYQQFMNYQFTVMQGQRRNMTDKQRKDLDKAFRLSFPQNLISWASEDIIKKYGDWVRWDDQEANADILELEQILLAMRKDLGYTNSGLKKGDLLKTFLKGVDARLSERETR